MLTRISDRLYIHIGGVRHIKTWESEWLGEKTTFVELTDKFGSLSEFSGTATEIEVIIDRILDMETMMRRAESKKDSKIFGPGSIVYREGALGE